MKEYTPLSFNGAGRSCVFVTSGGKMRLSCEVETTYNLAQTSGMSGTGSRARASISLGKKAGGKGGRDELFLLVSTTKNVAGIKYKVALKQICPFQIPSLSLLFCSFCLLQIFLVFGKLDDMWLLCLYYSFIFSDQQ